MQKISLKDIANKSGVSVGTVDRVIHGRGRVSKATEKKVQKAIDELDYTPNLMARSLARKESFKIAALLPTHINDPFWEQPVIGISNAYKLIKDFGFTVDIFPFDDNIPNNLFENGERVINGGYHAVLVAPILLDEGLKVLELCEDHRIPYVQINTFIKTDHTSFLSYVGQDSYGSGVLAGKLLNFAIKPDDTLLILHLEKEVYNSQHLLEKEKGFQDFFRNENKNKPKIIQMNFSDLGSENKKTRFLKSLVSTYPELAGVFVTSSKLFHIVKELKAIAKKDLHLVGFDLIEENLHHLKSNNINFLINQNPTRQGYLGIMTLFNYLLQKEESKNIQYLPLDVVMKENLDYYLEDLNVKAIVPV